MLVSSRLVTPGQYTIADSNGTDTGSNSRISTWNQSNATVTKIRIVHPNWKGTLTNESPGTNAITVTSAFEYPAGTFNQITWGSASSISIADGNQVSDEITLTTPWPHDAQAWVRTYVTVSSGQVWSPSYIQDTGTGEAVDSGTNTTDKTMSGTITNALVHGYGPVAIIGTAWSSQPRNFAFALIGDSLGQGPGGNKDDRGNSGPWGRACGYDVASGVGLKVPFLNLAIGGQAANSNQPNSQMKYRIDLLRKVRVTNIGIHYGTNDLATDSPATIETNVLNIANYWLNNCVRVTTETLPPKTTSSDGWITTGNQTPVSPGWNGSPANYATFNTWVRTTPSPFVGYAETASSVETSLNSATWQIGGGTLSTNLTDDGVHWSVISTSPEVGGTFLARDAAITALRQWGA